jgi:hypothetical protein
MRFAGLTIPLGIMSTPTNYAALLDTEADLLKHFVNGQSIEECATAAAKAPEAVFLATAAASPQVRLDAFERWRSRQVAALVASNDVVANYLDNDCPEDICAGYLAGKLGLDSLSEGIVLAQHEKQLAAEAAAAAANERLEKVLRKNVTGTTGSDTAWGLIARGLVICEDGTLKLFTSDRVARDWAIATGKRCWAAEVAYRGEFLG